MPRTEADFNAIDKKAHPMCKSCLDWSERRNHLAGSLGHWILTDLLNKGWAAKAPDSRAILFTRKGLLSFSSAYGIPESNAQMPVQFHGGYH
jgi:hypothetical protein